ncbi:hypothetical protein ACFL14_01675 [Patescibacteria group bacterium]
MLKKYHKIKKYLFIILFITLAITYFTRSSFKKVDRIDSNVLNEPIQKELEDNEIIKFTKDDFEYELTPLYDYEVSSLVVRKMDYTWLSIYKTDSVFPVDLCMLWGSNIENNIYKDDSLKFSQDMRFCFGRWSGDLEFDKNAISNTHIVVNDKTLEKKIKKISIGDQVKLRGILVDVEAKNLGSAGKYDPESLSLKSSTIREDSGAGACEIVYVQDIEILQKGNQLSHILLTFSFYSLILLIIFDICLFFVRE